MRLNIRKVKLLIWLLCVAALGGAGWAFWTVYKNTKVERIYDSPPSAEYSELLMKQTRVVGEPVVIGYDEQRRNAIWDAIVDGTLRPVPVVKGPDDDKPVKKEVVIKPIAQVLEIGLIVHSGDPLARFAAVSYLPAANITSNSKAARIHVTEGTTLEPPYDVEPYLGEVVRIGTQEVVFSWGGKEVSITPKLGAGGNDGPLAGWSVPDADDPRADLEEWPEETQRLLSSEGKTQILLGSKTIETIRTDPSKHVLKDIRTRPFTPAGGGKTLLELTAVEEGSVAEEVGFESGDQIISVNGVPMSSISSAINWYQANPDEPSYTIVYQRFGKIDTITLYPPN